MKKQIDNIKTSLCIICFAILSFSSVKASEGAYAASLRPIENSTARIAWILKNIDESFIDFNPSNLEEIKRLVGAENEEKTIISELAKVNASFEALYNVIVGYKGPNKIIDDNTFIEKLQGINNELSEFYSYFFSLYTGFFAGESEKLVGKNFADGSNDIPTLLEKIDGHLKSTKETVSHLATKIVSSADEKLIKIVIPIADIIDKIDKNCENTITKTKVLFGEHDGRVKNAMASYSSSIHDIYFTLHHELILNESTEVIGAIECVTSAISSQIQLIKSLEFTELKNVDPIVSDIDNISENINNIATKINLISEVIKNRVNCGISSILLDNLLGVRDCINTCFNKIESIFEKSFGGKSGITIPKNRNEYVKMDFISLIDKIYDDIKSVFSPNQISEQVNEEDAALKEQSPITKIIAQISDSDIATAVIKLKNNLSLLAISLEGDDDSLCNILTKYNICEHNFPKNSEENSFLKILDIKNELLKFPEVSEDICCANVAGKLDTVRVNLGKIVLYIQAISQDSKSYVGLKNKSWLDISEAINVFLNCFSSEEEIETLVNEKKCQSKLLDDYFKKMANASDVMRDSIEKSEMLIGKAISYEEQKTGKKGCNDLVNIISDINKIINKFDGIIQTINMKLVDESDYHRDLELQKSVHNIFGNLEKIHSQIGNDVPLLSVICQNCVGLEVFLNLIKERMACVNVNLQTLGGNLLKSFCCKKQLGYLLAINKNMSLIKNGIVQINIEIPNSNLNFEQINAITSHNNELSEVLQTIIKEIAKGKDFYIGTSELHPCVFINLNGFSESMQIQVEQISRLIDSVANVFGISNIIPASDFNSDDFCASTEEQFLICSNLFNEISDLSDAFKDALESKNKILYSSDLVKSITEIKNNLDIIGNDFSAFVNVFSGSDCLHADFNMFNGYFSKISENFDKASQIIEDSCCSFIAEEISKANANFSGLNKFFTVISTEYVKVRAPLNADLFVELNEEITGAGACIKNVKDRFDFLFNSDEKEHCKLHTLYEPFKFFNNAFGGIVNGIISVCKKEFGYTDEQLFSLEEKGKLNCASLGDSVQELKSSFIETIENIKKLSEVFSIERPFNAKHDSIFVVIDSSSSFLLDFSSVINHFELFYADEESTKKNCNNCNCNENLGVTILEKNDEIKASLNTIKDLLSKTGCCDKFAISLFDFANTFKETMGVISCLGEAAQLKLHISKETECGELLSCIKFFFDSLNIKLESFLGGMDAAESNQCCSMSLFQGGVNEISQLFTAFKPNLLQISKIFPVEINENLVRIEYDKSKSGCESLGVACESIKGTFENFMEDFKGIIKAILGCRTQKYYPKIVGLIEEIGGVLKTTYDNTKKLIEMNSSKVFCMECGNNIFRFETNKILSGFLGSFLSFSDLLNGKDLNSLTEILRQYQCSETTKILFEISDVINYVGGLIKSITENKKSLELTARDDFGSNMKSIYENFNYISASLSAYAASIRSVDYELFDSVGLNEIKKNINSFSDSLINLAKFGDIEYAQIGQQFEERNCFNNMGGAVNSINEGLKKIYESLGQFSRTMQNQKVYYAYSGVLLDFFKNINLKNIIETVRALFDLDACQYCKISSDNFIVTLSLLDRSLETLKQNLQSPTCCIEISRSWDAIARKSFDIIEMCNYFIASSNSFNSEKFKVDDFVDSTSALKELMLRFKNLGTDIIKTIDNTDKNTNCFVSSLGEQIQKIDTFCEDVSEYIKGIFQKLELTGFQGVTTNNPYQQQICVAYGDSMKKFTECFGKLAEFCGAFYQKVQATEAITYNDELIYNLGGVISELEFATANYGKIAKTLKEICECTCCKIHEVSLANCFFEIATPLGELNKNFRLIRADIQDKCCSNFMKSFSKLYEQTRLLSSISKKLFIDNEKFITCFFHINELPFLLPILNGDLNQVSPSGQVNQPSQVASRGGGQPGILNKLLKGLNDFYDYINTSGESSSENLDCRTEKLIPYLDIFTEIFSEITVAFRKFYEDNCYNGWEDVVEPKKIVFNCENNLFDDCLECIRDTAENIENLISLKKANEFSFDYSALIAQSQRTIEILNEINNVLSNLAGLQGRAFCINCNFEAGCFYSLMQVSKRIINTLQVFSAEETNCCENFGNAFSKFATEMAKLEINNKKLLLGFSNDLNYFNISGMTVVYNTANSFFEKIISGFSEANSKMKLYKESFAQSEDKYCLGNFYSGFLQRISLDLEKLNDYMKQYTKFEMKDFEISSDKENIFCVTEEGNIKKTNNCLDAILTDWDKFKTSFLYIYMMRYQQNFLCCMQNLGENFMKMQEELYSWNENCIMDTESGKQNIFCSNCHVPDGQFEYNFKGVEIRNIFQSITDHMQNKCNGLVYKNLFHINNNLSKLSEAFKNMTCNENFSFDVFELFFNKFLSSLKGVGGALANFSDLGIVAGCNSFECSQRLEMVDSALKILATTVNFGEQKKQIKNSLVSVYESVNYEQYLANIKLIGFFFKTFFDSIIKKTSDDNKTKLFIFFENLEECLDEIVRNLDLTIDEFSRNEICCLKPINFKIEKTFLDAILAMKDQVVGYKEQLKENNCCDVHANCIYTVNTYLKEISLFPNLSLEKINTVLCGVESLLNLVSIDIQNELLTKTDNHCSEEKVKGKFYAEIIKLFKENFDGIAGDSWNKVSVNSRSDCEFLPNLYAELSETITRILKRISSENSLAEHMNFLINMSSIRLSMNELMNSNGHICPQCNNIKLKNSIFEIDSAMEDAQKRVEEEVKQQKTKIVFQTSSEIQATIQLLLETLESASLQTGQSINQLSSELVEKLKVLKIFVESILYKLGTTT